MEERAFHGTLIQDEEAEVTSPYMTTNSLPMSFKCMAYVNYYHIHSDYSHIIPDAMCHVSLLF